MTPAQADTQLRKIVKGESFDIATAIKALAVIRVAEQKANTKTATPAPTKPAKPAKPVAKETKRS